MPAMRWMPAIVSSAISRIPWNRSGRSSLSSIAWMSPGSRSALSAAPSILNVSSNATISSSISVLLAWMKLAGLLMRCATPAASWPIDASRSASRRRRSSSAERCRSEMSRMETRTASCPSHVMREVRSSAERLSPLGRVTSILAPASASSGRPSSTPMSSFAGRPRISTVALFTYRTTPCSSTTTAPSALRSTIARSWPATRERWAANMIPLASEIVWTPSFETKSSAPFASTFSRSRSSFDEVSTTTGVSGAAARTRFTVSMPSESGSARSVRMMSKVSAASVATALARSSTCTTSKSAISARSSERRTMTASASRSSISRTR